MRAVHVPPLFGIKIVIGRGLVEVVIVLVVLRDDARARVADAHLVAHVHRMATCGLRLAVDGHRTFGDEFFGLTARGHEAGQLNELAEFDGLAFDLDF